MFYSFLLIELQTVQEVAINTAWQIYIHSPGHKSLMQQPEPPRINGGWEKEIRGLPTDKS